MRYFSIKILCACILLPPVLYLLTVQIMERSAEEHITRQIEAIFTGDPQALLDGSARLEDVIEANINRYLADSFLARNGFAIRVSVTASSGKLVYPVLRENEETGLSDSRKVALENFAALSAGLTVRVEARLEHNRLISNSVLCGYALAAMVVLLVHYQSAGRHIQREEDRRRLELGRLLELDRSNTIRLAELQQQRELMAAELGKLRSYLQDERARAERNEDELIGEIDALEKRLAENIELQAAQQAETQSFKEKLSVLEKEQRREERGRQKAAIVYQRRFATLYKNVLVSDRAVDGFVDLNEDMRLKAEEVVHQLNANPDLVSIKRKVFGKKNRETVLEVVFAYKGRLYFRRGADRRAEIVAIGTKNTQERELEFLASL
jgi:hypothetical protein